jgi:hypothetical protein
MTTSAFEPSEEILQTAAEFFEAFLETTLDEAQRTELDEIIHAIWDEHDEPNIARISDLAQIKLDSAEKVQVAGGDLIANNLRLSLWSMRVGSPALFEISTGATPPFPVPLRTQPGFTTLMGGGAGLEPLPGTIEVPGD